MIDTFVFGVREEDETDGTSSTGTDTEAEGLEARNDVTEEESLIENELLVERHLLRTQLTAVETQLRERNDELYFAGLKLKEKEGKVKELTAELEAERGKAKAATDQLTELQRTCQAQYSQILELQYQVRRNSEANGRRLDGSSGVDKFHKQKDVAVNLLKKNRALAAANRKMRGCLELLENIQMGQEDPTASTVGDMLQLVRQRDEAARKEKLASWQQRNSSAASSHTARSEAGWDLPVHKTILTTPDDPYIDCKLKTSIFGGQLGGLKEDLTPLLKTFKDYSDKTVVLLWQIFTNKRASYRPKDEFYKETSQLLTKTKVFVADVIRKVNHFIKNMVKDERGLKEAWLAETVDNADFECQVEIEGPVDPKIAVLESEVAMLKQRLARSRQESTAREQELMMAKDKAELCLTTVQKKLFNLHQELYTALHQVYKHRFKWVPRLPNPLRDFKAKTRKGGLTNLSVVFNAHLGAVVDKDIEYLRKFGEYFTSDEVFGVDMSALCDERRAKEQQQQQKDRHRKVLVERDGNNHTDEGRTAVREVKRRGSAPLVGEKENFNWDMTRMENWRAKQSLLWEKRRCSNLLMSRESITYVADKQAPPDPSQHQRPTIEKQIDDLINWKRDLITATTKTQPPPDPTPPAISRQRSGTFNRIMLKRRNIPLRPSSEPNLNTKRYLVEGNKGEGPTQQARPMSVAN